MGKMKDEAFEKMTPKQKEFWKMFENFLEKEWSDSGATPDEWVNLFFNVSEATRQGDGMLWSEIKDIITEVLR